MAIRPTTGDDRSDDPERRVDEPLRAALATLIVESTVGIGVVITAVVCPTLVELDEPWCTALHVAGPLLLAVWVAATAIIRALRPAPTVSARVAWQRAVRIDAQEAQLAMSISIVAAVSVAFAFLTIVRFYYYEPGMRATAITAILPGLGALYLGVVATGARNIRDRLAMAGDESDARLRSYWRSVAAHKVDGQR